MTHRGHHAFGALALVGAIAFAFGPRTARVVVGSVLVIGVLAFLYVLVRVVTETV